MNTKKAVFLALALLVALAALPWQRAAAEPKRYYVTQTGTGSGIGGWGAASSDLKGIMDSAGSGDEIWVAKGTYSPGLNGGDTFLLKRGVKVYGGFAGTEASVDARNWVTNVTTLNGNSANWHVVTGQGGATSDDTRLDGFTITGGKANGSASKNMCGGGIYNDNSSPTVANCVFSGNTADVQGGGMYNSESSPAVEGCTFSSNTANEFGGGMYNSNSSPTVANCTFSDNSADYGGGMYNYWSSPTVANCAFTGNTANGEGGGMYNNRLFSLAVTNCTFSGNTASLGGGVYNNRSSPAVENCAFSGNTANEYGGGMYNDNSSPKVTNCTFSGNTANLNGGGIQNLKSSPTVVNCTFSGNTADNGGGMFSTYNSSPTLANTILWGNTAANDSSSADIYQNGSTLTLKSCVVGTYKLVNNAVENTSDLIKTNPLLNGFDTNLAATNDPTKVYIYKLGSGSPAINKGLPKGNTEGIAVPDKDQIGTLRPQGAGVDIGAYESLEAAVPVTGVSLNKTITALTVGNSETLTATVEPDDAANKAVTWVSDKPAIATVNNGVVTGKALGTAVITVTTDDGGKTATCTVVVRTANPRTWHVTQNGAGNKDASDWANAAANLKDIMDIAESGDQVWVAKGTYSPGGDVMDTFLLKKGVMVYGGFAGGETDLSARNWVSNVTTLNGNSTNWHVVTGQGGATSDDTRLDGFTITGGKANENGGGGMYNYNSSPTVANCTFSGNTAYRSGGGMCNNGSSPTVTNCTFTGNTTENGAKGGGGGMHNVNSNPTVENCVFSGNTTCTGNAKGGGMFNDGSSPTVTNCAFTGNEASNGGGMCNANSSPKVTNCTFSGNGYTTSTGGGMYNDESSPKVTNCTFSGNKAGMSGGGMCNYSNSSPAVVNCTFSGNKANNAGGGMHNWNDSSPTLVNTILWDNTALADWGPDIYQNGSTLTLKSCVVGTYKLNGVVENTSGLIQENPRLNGFDANLEATGDPAIVYIYKLGSGSSAIDKGLDVGTHSGVTVPGTDQLGTARPKGAGVDIGAFEAVVCTVTYDKNGGGGEDMTPAAAVVGVPFELPACTFTPPAGNQFKAWAIGSVGGTQVNAGNTYTFDADSTVFALWEPVNYQVKVNGGTSTPPNSAAYNTPVTITANTPSGQRFIGWTVVSGGASLADASAATTTFTMPASDVEITANFENIPVTGVTLTPPTLTLTVGGAATLQATVTPPNAANQNVTWSSDKPAIAAVDNGVVTAVSVGTATITVTTAEGSHQATCTVTVNPVAVTEVTLDQATLNLTAGGATGTLTATVLPADAANKNVTWASSNEAVATVADGVVTPKAAGQAIITVKTVDGGKTATCTVTVNAAPVAVTGVTLAPATLTLTAGGATGTLTATVLPADATNKNVTWSSDKPAVATVDAAGRVTAVGVGQATITVKTDDGNKTAACTVTVSAAGAQYTTVSGDGQTHTRGDGEDLLLTVKRNIGDEKTFGLFRQMLKDGVPVAESNYTRAAGSLIIRLKSAWLDTLAAGLHHLSFVFEDGLAQASFTIRARPGSFEDVTTPSDSFTFTKRWQGGTGKSIDWTLYDEMDRVAHKLFNKKVVSSTEWRYNAWFDRPVSRYVVEKPVSGYKTRYENVGVYAGITDRCCDGGAIINYKIPKTGDEANLALWAGLALLGVAGISAVLVTGRRRRKGK